MLLGNLADELQRESADLWDYVGTYVLVEGLATRPDLNGRFGFITEVFRDRHRCAVRISRDAVPLSMPPRCLREIVMPWYSQCFSCEGGVSDVRGICPYCSVSQVLRLQSLPASHPFHDCVKYGILDA